MTSPKINVNPILATSSIIAVLISAFFIWQNSQLKKLLSINSFDDCAKANGSQIQTIELKKCITKNGQEFISPTQTPKEEPWKKYEGKNFSFEYPESLDLEEDEKSVKLTFWGKNQKENTELYDGYSFSITQLESENQKPADIAKKERETTLEVCEEVSEIKEVNVNNTKAYEYELNCQAKTKNIYLENQKINYQITLAYAGDEKYKEILEKILSSLKFTQE